MDSLGGIASSSKSLKINSTLCLFSVTIGGQINSKPCSLDAFSVIENQAAKHLENTVCFLWYEI